MYKGYLAVISAEGYLFQFCTALNLHWHSNLPTAGGTAKNARTANDLDPQR